MILSQAANTEAKRKAWKKNRELLVLPKGVSGVNQIAFTCDITIIKL